VGSGAGAVSLVFGAIAALLRRALPTPGDMQGKPERRHAAIIDNTDTARKGTVTTFRIIEDQLGAGGPAFATSGLPEAGRKPATPTSEAQAGF